MAAVLTYDEIDFEAFKREKACKAKVRKASVFIEDLLAEFAPKPEGYRGATMRSSRMGSLIDFRPGEVTTWFGYNGHRKSMFLGQVMADLCRQGHKTLTASFEMDPWKTLARMARQVFGTYCPTNDQLKLISRWTDGRLWIFDHEGNVDADELMAVIRYANGLQITQVFIDSMQFVCASEEQLDAQSQFMTDLLGVCRETGVHAHLVAHCKKPIDENKPPSKYDIRGSSAISDKSHNIIGVWANQQKKARLLVNPHDMELRQEPDAQVQICKQRNGEFEGRLKFWVDENSFRFTDERTTQILPWDLFDSEQQEFSHA
ncbi:MAG: hypothetical protein EBR82_09775 [Caulobacteraceae bacterium]|nr:hypothetical protein [Caulobacteraceae bacterium]